MFGLNRFKKTVPAPVAVEVPSLRAPHIAPEKLDEIVDILSAIGLLEPKHFKATVMNPNSYFGGSLEWSERATDMRFIVEGWCGGRICRIWATPLKGATNYSFSNELIADVNKRVNSVIFS